MKLDLIKLSHYNIPHLVEDSKNDWVSFGEDNLYPNYLLDLFLGSAINGALIKSIGAMIYGEGLAATNADDNTDTKESYLRLTELLHNSDDDVLKDLAMDLKLFGGCYVNVIWSRDRSKIAKMKHIPAQYIRSGKMIDGEIDTYYYSANWAKCKKAEYRPRAYAAFNTEDRTQASQILMIRDKNPALFYGFAPDYVAATDWIQMELEIAQFHLSNITSGMTPSMHVGFSNGVPTDEERRTIERQLNAKFAGSGNAGKILITFNDGKETAPIIEPIQMNDAQSAWEGMSKQAVNQILAGHRVTSPILFGIRAEGGGLGNNADELRDAFSLFTNTVVIPFQNTLLKGLDKIFRVNDINLDLYFKSLKPADFIDLEVTKTQSEEDQEKEGVTKEDINTDNLKQEFKDLQDIDTKPTQGMIDEAIKGLEWRREYGRGGTEIAVARARNISNNDNLSLDTIKRMNSFFARHEVDKQAEGFNPGEEGYPSAGRIAWALWGGDAGQSWSKKKVKEIEGVRDDLSDDEFDELLDNLQGEQIDLDKWEIVDEQDEGVIEDYEEWADDLIRKKENFADEIRSKEDLPSQLDKSYYRVRFKYYRKNKRANKKGNGSRKFCQNMMRLSNAGFVYRLEDIDKASREGVNRQLGHKGRPYSLWKWKGGRWCKHSWRTMLYRLKEGTELKEGQSLDDDYKKVDSIPKSYKPRPRGIDIAEGVANASNNWYKYPGTK
tara:strand:+ start:628 stop:2790 length:2163 start_codon:yes stop_codon:yes gene_type:complete